jgi:glucose-6-phosphate-specific signal transduction histidine kinase
VKFLLLLMVLSLVGLVPFVVLRKRWAVRLWRQLKIIILVYAIVIAISGIMGLVLNWNDFYG